MSWLVRVAFAGCVFGLSAGAQVAPSIDVPAAEKLVIQLHGKGVQIYTCAAKDGSWAWTLKAPEAKLLDDAGHEVGTHFAGPRWRLLDGSEVQGKLIATQPHAGTIPWLLLSATSTGGDGKLSKVDMVRRTETSGGVAPADGCDAAHAGVETRVAYAAIYGFYTSR